MGRETRHHNTRAEIEHTQTSDDFTPEAQGKEKLKAQRKGCLSSRLISFLCASGVKSLLLYESSAPVCLKAS
jgi:hypothetical protein